MAACPLPKNWPLALSVKELEGLKRFEIFRSQESGLQCAKLPWKYDAMTDPSQAVRMDVRYYCRPATETLWDQLCCWWQNIWIMADTMVQHICRLL